MNQESDQTSRPDQAAFEDLQAGDRRAERRILLGEMALLVAIALGSLIYARLIA